MTPVLLAFDTSTEALAVALQWTGGRLAWNGDGGAQASVALLPTVQRLLAQAGLTLGDLDAIAFGQGPGAFTGLRTACSVAQGLAFGADKPVLQIDSLLIVAEDERAGRGWPDQLDVAVAMDARMGELYAACYRWSDQAWQVLQAPGLWEPQAWVASFARVPAQDRAQDRAYGLAPVQPGSAVADAQWPRQAPPGLWWAGSGLPLLAELPEQAGSLTCTNRAEALLRLADQAWHQGRAVPAEQALPVYLRDKVALTTAERQALKAAP